MSMDLVKDMLAEANGRAVIAFLHACGGEAEIHARDFELDPGDCSRAVRRLHKRGKIVRIGDCKWRLVQ